MDVEGPPAAQCSVWPDGVEELPVALGFESELVAVVDLFAVEVLVPSASRRQGALLDAVTTVLQLAGCPLRVREVHAAVEELYGERVPFSSVNEALSTHGHADGGRFRRVRYGTYGMAER
ncbi:MAG TPA: hypothetical protein VMU58_14485 [Gaiellaceae bacterium]|nr:hypothetical protein [Gaiellaceae bacterium]